MRIRYPWNFCGRIASWNAVHWAFMSAKVQKCTQKMILLITLDCLHEVASIPVACSRVPHRFASPERLQREHTDHPDSLRIPNSIHSLHANVSKCTRWAEQKRNGIKRRMSMTGSYKEAAKKPRRRHEKVTKKLRRTSCEEATKT